MSNEPRKPPKPLKYLVNVLVGVAIVAVLYVRATDPDMPWWVYIIALLAIAGGLVYFVKYERRSGR